MSCDCCGLRYRVPRDEDVGSSGDFYQIAYKAGFTTDCPGKEELGRLVRAGFCGSETDFSGYIDVLVAAGLERGAPVLDFGCSWGYGSWQLRRAGFDVYSCEISKVRACYATQKLGCAVIEKLSDLPTKVRCFFSAHVIEHLPDPNLLWDAAMSTISDSGVVICFCPNGDPSLESRYGRRRYDMLWGKVHPLLVTPEFAVWSAQKWGFNAKLYTSPYDLTLIRQGRSSPDLGGAELLLIARRPSLL